jgi:hypothetical protein
VSRSTTAAAADADVCLDAFLLPTPTPDAVIHDTRGLPSGPDRDPEPSTKPPRTRPQKSMAQDTREKFLAVNPAKRNPAMAHAFRPEGS